MAWTWPTAAFFAAIALMLLGMTAWQLASPTVERTGVFGLTTTRGDRLFISLLGAAFIHLGWIGLSDLDLWWALGVSALWAAFVFLLV